MTGPFSASLSILTYHRVAAAPDPLLPGEPDADDFDWQLASLKRWFNVLPLSTATTLLAKGGLPKRSACVTFDDGYLDNVTVALPILERHGISATFFIATGYLEGRSMWNDRVIQAVRSSNQPNLDARCVGLSVLSIESNEERLQAIDSILSCLKYRPWRERDDLVSKLAAQVDMRSKTEPMMRAQDVRVLHERGMEIGAHTVNHPILTTLDHEEAEREIAESKDELEEIINAPVTLFAYPNGKPSIDYARAHVDIVRAAGFRTAVCTAWGVATARSDPFQLPRFTPWDKTPARFSIRLLANTFRASSERV